jgi:gliding motility-associated-like protein
MPLADRILILLITLSFPALILAQGDKPPPPDPPVMDYVSVDTATGFVYVTWKPSPSGDIAKYIIYEWRVIGIDTAGFVVDSVGRDTLEYLWNTSEASEKAVSMAVAGTRAGSDPSTITVSHTTMYLTTQYDSCKKEMLLEWTPYIGWDSAQYVRHEIYVSTDGGHYAELTRTDADSTNCIHVNIEDNHQYCYFVKAIRNDGVASLSNIACRHVRHPLHPLWIDAEQASAIGEDQISVDFYIEESAEVTSYRLYRRTGPGKPLIPIQDFTDVSGLTLSYLDQDPLLSTAKPYQYKLYSLDVCGDTVVGSNLAGNVVLQVNSLALQAFLAWTPYREYETGVKSYHIYRITNMGDPQQVYEAEGTDTAYTDNLDFVSGSDIEDEICYYVIAEENDGASRGEQGFSQSNTACVSITPNILMPNAFTPNDDGHNDIIKPVLSFIPQKFLFQVFDRWGARVFHTTDPETGWDGAVNGGTKASEGVYIYFILLTTTKGIEVEQRGEITLFYP